ncbi:MAG: serine/threonine-protein kinase [Acidobacteriota bacterium]
MLELHRVGDYVVVESLGEGAMGRVYKARDMLLDRVVAIKTIRVERIAEPTNLRARFEQETRVLASLMHPNIVSLLDYGEEGGLAYFVMEYVDGQPLESWADAHPFDLSDIFCLTEHLANALDYAHAKGIVHRDIKPGNIMIPRDNVVAAAKLTDFGIAKLLDASALTQTGGSLGTIEYMSPEQVAEAPVDARSDVWGLAVVAHQLIAGNLPFEAETYPEVLMRIQYDSPSPPADIGRWDLSRGQWDNVFLRALAKDPERRFQSAGAFAEALGQELIPVSAQLPTLVSPTPYPLEPETPEEVEHAAAALRAPPEPAVGEAAALIAAVPARMRTVAPVEKKPGIRMPSATVLMAGAALVIAIATAVTVWRRTEPALVNPPPEMLLIDSEPPGAHVTIGGQATGMKTPARISQADIEREGVVLKLDCYEDFRVEPTNAPRVRARLVLLRPRTLVTTDPPGAEILLEDGSRLKSPADVDVPCGSVRKARVSKMGYRSASLVIESPGLSPETHLDLQVGAPSVIDLVSSHAYLIMISDSAGKVVWQGRAPASVAVMAGSYMVRYASPDCAEYVRESQLAVAESQTLPFLLPAPARLASIACEPQGAQILIDGRELGERVAGICLSPTTHTIVAVWPDGGRAERTLTLGPGQVVEPVVLRHPGRP